MSDKTTPLFQVEQTEVDVTFSPTPDHNLICYAANITEPAPCSVRTEPNKAVSIRTLSFAGSRGEGVSASAVCKHGSADQAKEKWVELRGLCMLVSGRALSNSCA